MSGLLTDFEAALDGSDRHGAMLHTVDALAVAGAGGAYGVPGALAMAEAAFTAVKGSAGAEDFGRALRGSVARIADGLLDVYTHADRLAFVVEGLSVADVPSPLAQEGAFWDSRPELSTIRGFAQSRIASPWAVLGGVLTDVVSTVPPTFRLPPIIGGEGSLNLFVGLVGASGDGKGVATRIASEVLDFKPEAVRYDVGSGEGLIRAYVEMVKEKGEAPGLWT